METRQKERKRARNVMFVPSLLPCSARPSSPSFSILSKSARAALGVMSSALASLGRDAKSHSCTMRNALYVANKYAVR